MAKRKTDEEFKKEVYDLVEDDYTFLDSYANSKTKLRVRHNKCNNIYEVTPSHFLMGTRCPFCNGNTKKTDAQFKQEVYNLVGDEYVFLDAYVNTHTKLRVKHNTCGHTYEVRPHDFIMGIRCPFCNGGIKKSNAQFKQEVFDLVGDEYVFLDTYVNNKTKLKVKHNKCGNVYEVKPGNFFTGKRCPYCYAEAKGEDLRKTDKQFKQEIFDLVGNEYTFLDPYVNAKTKIKVKHNKCGNTYEVRPNDFFSKHSRCPYCTNPKGEDIINKVLKALEVKYEYQKTFEDLKDNRVLSYDFFISSQSVLIEYQGRQHYQPVDYFGGESQFKLQQKHDKMKAEYAKDSGYNLITIPYTEDTFSKIKKYLLSHGLSK